MVILTKFILIQRISMNDFFSLFIFGMNLVSNEVTGVYIMTGAGNTNMSAYFDTKLFHAR